MRSPVLLVVAVTVVAGSTLAGCGATANPLARVLAAAKATSSQSALAHLSLAGSSAFGARYDLVLAPAAFAFPSRIGYERVDLPPLADQKPRRLFLVFLPTKVYLQPLLAGGAALPGGKTWVSAAFTGPRSVEVDFPRFAAQVEGLNVQLLLDEILWGTASASLVGEPVVDHVPLSEYSVSVDLERVLSGAQAPSAGATRAAVRQELAAPGGRRFARISVWVDGPGRIVMLEAASAGPGLGRVSISLSGFGATPSTTGLPAAATVAPVSAVGPLAGGAGWPWIVGAG